MSTAPESTVISIDSESSEEELAEFLATIRATSGPGSAEAFMQEEQPYRDNYAKAVEETSRRYAPAFDAIAKAAFAAHELKEASK